MDSIFEYLTDLSSGVSYAIIFGILVACGLGFPLPEDIPLIASGYLVWDGTMRWLPALGMTLSGVLIGDTILFYIGRTLGMKFLHKGGVGSRLIKPKKIRRAQAYFRKYGDKIIFFARFVAGFRAAAFFLAGAMKVKYRRFLLLDGIAALLSVPIWIAIGYGLGYYFGDEITVILLQVKRFKNILTVVIFTILAIVAFRIYRQYKKSQANKKRRKGN